LPPGGRTNADAINALHTRTAGFANIDDDAVGLLDRCARHRLSGRSNCYDESKRDESGHFYSPRNASEGALMRRDFASL
jgi:hypothetical protein